MIKNEPNKKLSDGQILGYNVIAFVCYTLICIAIDNEGGFLAFFISIAQFLVCVIVAIVMQRWAWVLGGFIAVLIGFGTCVGTFVVH